MLLYALLLSCKWSVMPHMVTREDLQQLQYVHDLIRCRMCSLKLPFPAMQALHSYLAPKNWAVAAASFLGEAQKVRKLPLLYAQQYHAAKRKNTCDYMQTPFMRQNSVNKHRGEC